MTVQVRYHKSELEIEAEYDVFEADSFYVHTDNTLELRSGLSVIGIVHPERWDAVWVLTTIEGETQ